MTKMTNRERSELISLAKQRARIAKGMADHRAAELLADFEEQLAAEYAWDDDETWTEAHRIAEEAVAADRRACAHQALCPALSRDRGPRGDGSRAEGLAT